MTREEAIAELKTRYFSMSQCLQVEELHKANEAIDIAIEALQTEPSEDCISRQSIKKKLQEHHDFLVKANEGWVSPSVITKARIDEISNCIAEIVNEPSVQQEQRTGTWKIVEVLHGEWEGTKKYACDKCGEKVGVFKSNYCPNCGRRMGEGE